MQNILAYFIIIWHLFCKVHLESMAFKVSPVIDYVLFTLRIPMRV